MREFFRGWRRKIGVLTLAVACVFMGGRVRCQTNQDNASFDIGNRRLYLQSINTELIVGLDQRTQTQPEDWEPERQLSSFVGRYIDVDLRLWGVGLVTYHENGRPSLGTIELNLPYWSIVVPLTLVTFWLLVSKPLKSTPKKILEPIPEKVA